MLRIACMWPFQKNKKKTHHLVTYQRHTEVVKVYIHTCDHVIYTHTHTISDIVSSWSDHGVGDEES